MSGWQIAESLSVLTRNTLVAFGLLCLAKLGAPCLESQGQEGPGRLLTHTSGA